MTLHHPERDDEYEEDDNDDPTAEGHRDHDLSDAASLEEMYHEDKPWFTRRWVLLLIAFIVIVGLLLPFRNVL